MNIQYYYLIIPVLKRAGTFQYLLLKKNAISSPKDATNEFTKYTSHLYLHQITTYCLHFHQGAMAAHMWSCRCIISLHSCSPVKVDITCRPRIYSTYFVKNIAHAITYPLIVLFKRSVSSNYVPEMFKMAKIKLSYKVGSTTLLLLISTYTIEFLLAKLE